MKERLDKLIAEMNNAIAEMQHYGVYCKITAGDVKIELSRLETIHLTHLDQNIDLMIYKFTPTQEIK